MVPPESDTPDEGGPGFGQAQAPQKSRSDTERTAPRPAKTARTRSPLQAGLFDAIQIADGLEQTTGIDLTGGSER